MEKSIQFFEFRSRVVAAVFASLLISVIPFTSSRLCADFKVYPRLVTPNASDNATVNFDFDTFDDPKPELAIFDISGRKVKDIALLDPPVVITPDGWRFRVKWDGTDANGNLVMPGVYIYRWNETATVLSGTIVVAR